jgi:acetyl-CoA carboxylase carboxyl transferase subunit beta
MSWLTETVLPKIRSFARKSDTPDNLWVKCPNCGQMVFSKEMAENAHVCPKCDHHLRIGPAARFEILFDGEYTRLEVPEVAADPLKFKDSKRYTDRIKEARAKTGERDAVQVAEGRIGGNRAVVAVQNFAFMGGSMGMATGEALVVASDRAVAEHLPLIVVAAAGGARMQEGILSLMQMPRSIVAIERVRDKGLPYICVLAEPGALIGFAGQRVIEQTIRETLPPGFQRAEFLLQHGMIDMVVHRKKLKETLARLIDQIINREGTLHPGPEVEIPPPGEIPHGAALT